MSRQLWLKQLLITWPLAGQTSLSNGARDHDAGEYCKSLLVCPSSAAPLPGVPRFYLQSGS